jgi:hypothetical protein
MIRTRIADAERTEIPIGYPPAPDGQVLYVIGDTTAAEICLSGSIS